MNVKRNAKVKKVMIVTGALFLAFCAGFVFNGLRDRFLLGTPGLANSTSLAEAEEWSCSMHPQIRQPKAGKCPLCGMDLIPVAKDSGVGTDNLRQMGLSPVARKLAGVMLATVERRPVAVEISMVGKVRFDETRLAYISPRVSGRIDRLYANFAGVPVKAGDHLADMYSPDLVSAQQELLQTVKLSGDPTTSLSLLNATRERLRLWGLTGEQIAEIERSGQVRDHVTFYSPIGGIVVEKDVREGQYVETGTRLFTVADLTGVWVQLDAYESDLAWIRYAQEVVFEAEAYPGEMFSGTISFVDPILDPNTRTVKIRVAVPNADGRLKPEMFVRARVSATVGADGKVVRDDLRGKWISPMHPEIIKDGPGVCDICGMPLMRAEDLGYAAVDEMEIVSPLVIPASAPLFTGRRAVVYVALPEKEGVYEGREVALGPRAGNYYLVREGLEEGEYVVVNGAFKIDSALQIQGKSSMMAPTDNSTSNRQHGIAVAKVKVPEAFSKQVDGVLSLVLEIGDVLADDNMDIAAASKVRRALAEVDMTVLTGGAHERWMSSLIELGQALDKMVDASDIESFRAAFASLSFEMVRVVKMFGPFHGGPVYEVHCPMAFNNRGAVWLQKDKAIRNPYFGKAMLGCGDMVETIAPALVPTDLEPERRAKGLSAGGHAHE